MDSKFRCNGADAFRHGFGYNIPGEVLWMGYIAMCGLRGYGFSAVLPILVINKVWFLHFSLELDMFSIRSYFFMIIDKTIDKCPS